MLLRFSVIFMLCMHPDLTPPDFVFLWGYLNHRIYSNPRPRTLDQLKDNIRREIRNIPQETFPRVMKKYGCPYAECDWTERSIFGKCCLKFKGLIKAMEDKVGEKMPVTQTYRPNLQTDVVLVC